MVRFDWKVGGTVNTVKINTFADFLQLGRFDAVEIINPMNGQVVRTLCSAEGGTAVHILCGDGTEIVVPASQPVQFQPWVFDRGSLIFDFNGKQAKICTEYDHLREVGFSLCYLIAPSNEARMLAENESIGKNSGY